MVVCALLVNLLVIMTIIPSRIDVHSVRIFLSFDKQSPWKALDCITHSLLGPPPGGLFCTSEKSERRVHIGMRFMPTMQAVERRLTGAVIATRPREDPAVWTQVAAASMSTKNRNARSCGCLRQIGIQCCQRQARAQR